ncbi:MAG TPA: SRPBCC domain-containing protein [Caulobacteraceae bacterium]|jgi:uncharacterized protein YndB with AHSA1/START domain
MTAASPTAAQAFVVVERTYKAPAEELWALWTTRAGFESWWGPTGFRVEVHAWDARAGGELTYEMIADTPEMVAAMKSMGQPVSTATRGRFGEFRPHTRLSLIHVIDFIPGAEPYENTIEVDFFPAAEATRMVVTIQPHLDPHWTRMSIEGFGSQIKKLDQRFSRG